MKLYKLFLISMLFLVSVGGVCATDTDTNTTDYCLFGNSVAYSFYSLQNIFKKKINNMFTMEPENLDKFIKLLSNKTVTIITKITIVHN